jgi:hypothetical protein
METLVRAKYQEVEVEELFGDIASKAAASLGYNHALGKSKADSALAIIHSLDIHPFTMESVELYKEQAMHAALKARRQASLIFLALAALLYGIATPYAYSHFANSQDIVTIPLAIGAMCGLGAIILFYGRGDWRWAMTEIENYNLPIPIHVLQTALRVKAAIPGSKFQVEYLTREYTQEWPDPFLVLNVGDAYYYLEVWDEPKFEGRKTV